MKRGVIETQTANYVLNPLPERVRKERRRGEAEQQQALGRHDDEDVDEHEESLEHVIVKRDPVSEIDCPIHRKFSKKERERGVFFGKRTHQEPKLKISALFLRRKGPHPTE